MRPTLPSFFKLPRHYEFNYLPRFYEPDQEKREHSRRKIAMKNNYFEPDSVLHDSIVKVKADEKRKMFILSSTIRALLVIFFFLLAYFLAKYFGILVTSAQ